MSPERQLGFNDGVRACITRLHQYAKTMNDPHARGVLNLAASELGSDKPDPKILQALSDRGRIEP